MHKLSVLIDEGLLARARARYGLRGVGPRLRLLLEHDLANEDAVAPRGREPDVARVRTSTAVQAAGARRDVCPRCGNGGLPAGAAGKLRCAAGHRWQVDG